MDLAIELQPRLNDPDAQEALERTRSEEATSGRPRSFLDALSFPHQEVRRFLESRSRILKIGDVDDLRMLADDAPF